MLTAANASASASQLRPIAGTSRTGTGAVHRDRHRPHRRRERAVEPHQTCRSPRLKSGWRARRSAARTGRTRSAAEARIPSESAAQRNAIVQHGIKKAASLVTRAIRRTHLRGRFPRHRRQQLPTRTAAEASGAASSPGRAITLAPGGSLRSPRPSAAGTGGLTMGRSGKCYGRQEDRIANRGNVRRRVRAEQSRSDARGRMRA